MLMNVTNNNRNYFINTRLNQTIPRASIPRPSVKSPSLLSNNKSFVSTSNPPLNFSMVGRVFNVSSGCSSCGRG
jgi:hypothetical protein